MTVQYDNRPIWTLMRSYSLAHSVHAANPTDTPRLYLESDRSLDLDACSWFTAAASTSYHFLC